MNTSLSTTVITRTQCGLYRFFGCTLLVASIVNLFIGFRYLLNRNLTKLNYSTTARSSPIIIGMLICSILVIFANVPIVMIQCFTCEAYLNHETICKTHGVLCFAAGVFNMYIIAFLSFSRYLSILHKSSLLNRFVEHYSSIIVLCYGLLAMCWTLPPIFGFGNRFVREGAGFYCTLDWKNPSIHTRIFSVLVIFFNYFVPLIVLIYSNLRVSLTLHQLLKSADNSNYISLSRGCSQSKTSDSIVETINSHRYEHDVRLRETTNRLQRLKIDRRYALITALIAAQYIITWTPYTIVEILNISGRNQFLLRNPFLPTLCGLLAKLSLILNPIIIIHTNKMTET